MPRGPISMQRGAAGLAIVVDLGRGLGRGTPRTLPAARRDRRVVACQGALVRRKLRRARRCGLR